MRKHGREIAIVGGALAVVVALFVALSSGNGDEATDDQPQAADQAEAPAGRDDERQGEQRGGDGREDRGDADPPVQRTPTVRVRDGEPAGGSLELEVRPGAPVFFDVISDTAGEVHVHGYNVTEQLQPGKRVRISFPARIEGAFEIEMHRATDGGHVQLGELQVVPG